MADGPLFYTFFLGIVERRVVVASLKWCFISETMVYSLSTREGFD